MARQFRTMEKHTSMSKTPHINARQLKVVWIVFWIHTNSETVQDGRGGSNKWTVLSVLCRRIIQGCCYVTKPNAQFDLLNFNHQCLLTNRQINFWEKIPDPQLIHNLLGYRNFWGRQFVTIITKLIFSKNICFFKIINHFTFLKSS